MPRLRKFIFNNDVHFVTFGVEEGIMLPANPLVTFILKGALLRAQKHHPVKISHFVVNGTHIHMIVRVDNPEDLPGFMERFKTESAHYLNKLLGRRKRTVWCEGYDSPRLKNIADVVEYIVYTYINPVKDGLIDSINNYPGLSTWHLYTSNQKKLFARVFSRDSLFVVNQDISYKGFKKVQKILSKTSGKLEQLAIFPNDWMRSFGIEQQGDIDEINQRILERIKESEDTIQRERDRQSKPFFGRKALENQGIELTYIPKRKGGKKMWCLCSNRTERKIYISFLKRLALKASEVYQEWKRGNTALRMPEGVFAPRMPVVANLV